MIIIIINIIIIIVFITVYSSVMVYYLKIILISYQYKETDAIIKIYCISPYYRKTKDADSNESLNLNF